MDLEEENVEFQRFFNEIKAKNGSVYDIRTENFVTNTQQEFVASYVITNAIPKGEMKQKKRGTAQKKAYQEKSENRISIENQTKAKLQKIILPGQGSRKLSLIQSTYGTKGDFELVVPLTTGGLAHYTRNNDLEGLPWNGPVRFGTDLGGFDGAC